MIRLFAPANRLVEEADFRAAQELFGGQDLDKMHLKSGKDFEDFASALAHKYLLAHGSSPHYKTLVKALFKVGLHTDRLAHEGHSNGLPDCPNLPQALRNNAWQWPPASLCLL